MLRIDPSPIEGLSGSITNQKGEGLTMAKGKFYQYGFDEGKSASYDTDWQPGEMQEKFDNDELGEVVSQILENWQQMAGTIYYDDCTDKQLESFESGFMDGFSKGVKEQMKRKPKG
jgi:hypothetical protein